MIDLAKFRIEALQNYYAAERRAGTPPAQAYERLVEFAARLDKAMFLTDVAYIYMGSTR